MSLNDDEKELLIDPVKTISTRNQKIWRSNNFGDAGGVFHYFVVLVIQRLKVMKLLEFASNSFCPEKSVQSYILAKIAKTPIPEKEINGFFEFIFFQMSKTFCVCFECISVQSTQSYA